MNLSNTQCQIVEAPMYKPIQVLASAGSGKTRVLTERVRYILEKTKKEGNYRRNTFKPKFSIFSIKSGC